MSSQKGNEARNRPQKHKNVRAFKNDMHDTSHITKKINSLEFYGVCNRCKDIIDWKVKYKKYKPLTTAKKCVKCLEKKVKDAYYIVCQDCCKSLEVCSKCSKSCKELEFGETEVEKRRKEDEFQQELKQLSERQRRKFLRLLEKGMLSKENLMNGSAEFKKDLDLEDDLDELELNDDEDVEEGEDGKGEFPEKKKKSEPKEKNADSNGDNDDEEEDDEDDEFDEEDFDEEEFEDEEEEEIKPNKNNNSSKNKIKK